MNLLEHDQNSNDNDWREDIKSGADAMDEEIEETAESGPAREKKEPQKDKKPLTTPILLGVIVILLVCIIVLLLLMPTRQKQTSAQTEAEQIQQNITDYAKEQKDSDAATQVPEAAIVVEPENGEQESGQLSEDETEKEVSGNDTQEKEKTAVVIDIEDENDVSYTKEFILNEALPYFEDNNHEAIRDLAHLRRYVKLSAGLKGTQNYYYKGDVNSEGKPHGKGLAIYADNSYYYGDWSNGAREGDGRWFRFYINEKSKRNAKGKYTLHSYAGQWKNDLPNGEGAEHYDVDISKLEGKERILQNVVGTFTDGLYDGEMFANTVDYTGNVEEWDGTAEQGVFTLWKEMSAIGECSVWKKRNENDTYMDIDKRENKNQGIRELLKTE